MKPTKKTTRQIHRENRHRQAPRGLTQARVLLHNIRSMHNVGSAFRSADAFGINALWLSGYTPIPHRPEISKTALGADEHVAWRSFTGPLEAAHALKQEGYRMVGVEQTQQSRPITEFQPQTGSACCLVFGNEVTGIEHELLQECDTLIEIPQFGQKHSLNISVSVGVCLYDLLIKFSQG